jgi:hypothetical protein
MALNKNEELDRRAICALKDSLFPLAEIFSEP